MTTIFDTLTDPTGRPVVGAAVKLELLAAPDLRPGEGYVETSDSTIVKAVATLTDATGKYTLDDVVPNADINPTGTVYRVSYSSPLGTECFLINVPDTTSVWVGDLVTVPVGELVTVVEGPPGPAGPASTVPGPPGPTGPQGPAGTPGMDQATADARYVNVVGDSMSGGLSVANPITAAFGALPSISLTPGTDTGTSGYMSFYDGTGTRIGYFGFVFVGDKIFHLNGDAGVTTFEFNKPVNFPGGTVTAALKAPTVPVVKATAPLAADYGVTIMPVGAIWVQTP